MLVLRPSPVHGVGVFTTAAIMEGEHLRLWQEDDWRFVPFERADDEPDVRELRDIYCVTGPDGYHCPQDFHRMSIGWYMNHADTPNVRYRDNYEYYAVRDIAAGEEIFCDYRTLTPAEAAPRDGATPRLAPAADDGLRASAF